MATFQLRPRSNVANVYLFRATGQEVDLMSHQDRLTAVENLVQEAVWLPAVGDRGALRRAAGLTQQQVALAVGVGRVQVARWETGTAEPRGVRRKAYGHLLRSLTQPPATSTNS
ncbi:helix-turn-helix transcriptional regulator [Streptomyces virginiae]|uniref:helix-turn-helix transcriptional regulator n=1 Tax=Streptomyces virginiae TaxID=1961 RepID=UPI0036883292